MYSKHFVNPCPDWATALLNGFSQVLLLRNPLCGLCCLLAILLTAPDLVGGALLGASPACSLPSAAATTVPTARPGCTATTAYSSAS